MLDTHVTAAAASKPLATRTSSTTAAIWGPSNVSGVATVILNPGRVVALESHRYRVPSSPAPVCMPPVSGAFEGPGLTLCVPLGLPVADTSKDGDVEDVGDEEVDAEADGDSWKPP